MNKEFINKMELIVDNITPSRFEISHKDVEFVTNTFRLEELEVSQLNELRNNIVTYFQHKIENEERGAYCSNWQKLLTLTSAITHCVDLQLSKLDAIY